MKKIKAMIPFLIVISLNYFIFNPYLHFILYLQGAHILFTVAIVMMPAVCFGVSIIYGTSNSMNFLYVILASVLYIPPMYIFGRPILSEDMLRGAIIFGIIALAGNAIGMIFYKLDKRKKAKRQVETTEKVPEEDEEVRPQDELQDVETDSAS